MGGPTAILIPWIHDSTHWAHTRVMEYVHRIPMGSVLLLEVDPSDITFVTSFGVPSDMTKHRDSIRSVFGDEALVLLDVLSECQKRNVIVIPLEESGRPKGLALSHLRWREKNWHEKMKKIVVDPNLKKLAHMYVLTGAEHTAATRDLLRKDHISVQIPLKEIFREGAVEMGRFISSVPKYRKALEAKDRLLARTLFNKQKEFRTKKARRLRVRNR